MIRAPLLTKSDEVRYCSAGLRLGHRMLAAVWSDCIIDTPDHTRELHAVR